MLPQTAIGETMDEQAKATLDTAFAFMDAMGKGDMDGLTDFIKDFGAKNSCNGFGLIG